MKSKALSVEDLLKPRILVIADFWGNPFEVGDIIQFEDYKEYYDFITGDVLGKDWSTEFLELNKPYQDFSEGTKIVWNMRAFTQFPHLFRPLAWHELRSVEEMANVKYVKEVMKKGFGISKQGDVTVYLIEDVSFVMLDYIKYFISNETEYEQYLQSKK